MEVDEAFDPLDIRLFCAQGIVAGVEGVPYLVEEFWGIVRRT